MRILILFTIFISVFSMTSCASRANQAKTWNSLSTDQKQMYVGAFRQGAMTTMTFMSTLIKDKAIREKFIESSNQRRKSDISQIQRLVDIYYRDPALEYASIDMVIYNAMGELAGAITRDEALKGLRDITLGTSVTDRSE